MKIGVGFAKTFFQRLEKLPLALQEEVFEKIELFRNSENHKMLRVHKLHGPMKDRCSFWANYHIRIVFIYIKKNHAVLQQVGDHSLYD